jgi:metallo-beta-lactamase family protein
VHGETAACDILAQEIKKRFNLSVHVPEWKESLILKPKEMAFEKAPREEAVPDVQTAMLNAVVDLEKELDVLKRRIKKGTPSPADLDHLAYMREEFEGLLAD